jgi:hypothetical protein
LPVSKQILHAGSLFLRPARKMSRGYLLPIGGMYFAVVFQCKPVGTGSGSGEICVDCAVSIPLWQEGPWKWKTPSGQR